MPLYEFECENCGATFELMRSVNSRPPRKCPECGETGGVTKQVSAPAFQFKGTGWYVTDYAGKGKGGKSTPASGEEKSSGKEDGGVESSKDTSSATKESKESKGSKEGKEGKASEKAKD